MIVVTVEGTTFKSLQAVGHDCPPSILLITYIFSSNVIDFHGLLVTFSLAVALPHLCLDMVPFLFFILIHELLKKLQGTVLMYAMNCYNVAQIVIKTYDIQLHKSSFKINLPLSKE
jgi:hypothetical protein